MSDIAETDLIDWLQYLSGWSAREVPGIELSAKSLLIWDAIDKIRCQAAKIESDAKVIADLRAAFLVVLKAENKCWSFENGKPCDTAHCGCLLEMQCYIDDAAFKRRVDEQTAGENDGSARR